MSIPVLKLTGFTGEIPRMVPRLLPESAAKSALNTRLESGGLSPYRKPKFAHHITAIAAGEVETIYNHDGTWLAWDKPVYCAPGPVATDRLYVMGDGVPKMMAGGTTYTLAMTFPPTALTATPSGSGSGDVFTRGYVYTEVTSFGEESAPCPLSNLVNWQSGITVTLSGFRSPPAGRGITLQRIYRSQTTLNGTDLFFIAERAAGTGNYVDTIPLIQQGELLPSLEWDAPPDDLTGLITLPNGMMAAHRGKELRFCEPYRPHAWPEKYAMLMDSDIVALGAFGTTIVVATAAQPYMVSGTSPDTMAQEKLELNLPCINARGVVDLGYAIAYPSHDGLVVVSSSGARVVTDQLMTRNDWLRTAPDRFVSSQFFGRYMASYSYVDPTGFAQVGSFVIDLTGQDATLHRTTYKADASWYDVAGGKLYLCIGQDIYEWDAMGSENEILVYRSKEYVLPAPGNYGAYLIEASTLTTPEEDAAIEAAQAAAAAFNASIFPGQVGGAIDFAEINALPINGDRLMRLSQSRFVSVNIYADGNLVATVSRINRAGRLPAGFQARVWEVEVSANADIAQVMLAQTMTQLKEAS